MSPPTYAALRAREIRSTDGSLRPSMIRQRIDDPSPLGLNIDPDYQRGRAWTQAQCAAFIGYRLEGGACPPLFIQQWPAGADGRIPPDEVVDGKQRILATLGFVEGRIPAQIDGEMFFIHQWSPEDQRALQSSIELVLRTRIVRLRTRKEVLELYLRLNRGGTIHTEEEIARVRDLLAQESDHG